MTAWVSFGNKLEISAICGPGGGGGLLPPSSGLVPPPGLSPPAPGIGGTPVPPLGWVLFACCLLSPPPNTPAMARPPITKPINATAATQPPTMSNMLVFFFGLSSSSASGFVFLSADLPLPGLSLASLSLPGLPFLIAVDLPFLDAATDALSAALAFYLSFTFSTGSSASSCFSTTKRYLHFGQSIL